MSHKVDVSFQVADKEEFQKLLQRMTDEPRGDVVVGYRIDSYVKNRAALNKFSEEMEKKLAKNEHKKNWTDNPLIVLKKLLLLEVQKFEAYYDHGAPSDVLPSLVDISNYALMLWSRIRDEEQNNG